MIYVFKTSVQTDEEIGILKPKLNRLSQSIKWNFDLEDCDNILRVDSPDILPKMIIDLLSKSNFECQELE